jgi:PadR family transcriptional regulator PadR
MTQERFNIEQAQGQMRKGLLEYCILLTIARQEEAYTSDILQELKVDNLLIVEGTLYPLLSRLKTEELLDYSWQESKSGPPRKYYRLTPKGKKVLASLTETWESLSTSINSLYKKYEKNN